MLKKIFVVFLSTTIIYCPLFAATAHKAKAKAKPAVVAVDKQDASTETVTETNEPETVVVSTAVAALEDTSRVLTEAIAGLNYKIEYLTSRNNALNKEMDDIRDSLKEQKNALAELNQKQPEDDRLAGIESELSLVRTDLAQLKEDVGVVQSTEDKPKPVSNKQWYQDEWVAPAGLGLGALAFLIAVFRR